MDMDVEKPGRVAKANRIGDNKPGKEAMPCVGSKSTALPAKS